MTKKEFKNIFKNQIKRIESDHQDHRYLSYMIKINQTKIEFKILNINEIIFFNCSNFKLIEFRNLIPVFEYV